MKYHIYRAVVVGAGTMGAAIAAHLANAGVLVTLLDIVPGELTPEEEAKGLTLRDRAVRNRIVEQGLERAKKSRPASFFTPDFASRMTIGNLEDDFAAVRSADWVIEAIIENLTIKRELMARIDAERGPRTIVSTNTSGIPVSSIAEGRSESFRSHFLGTHFFNPPRYLKLLEVIPTADTLPEVTDFIKHFAEYRLGKGVVIAKDTPNFIGNRLAFGSGAFALDYILKHGYTVEEVDAVTGPPIGRPKTATFRLIDLVGVDVWQHVGRNLAPAIAHDRSVLPYLESQPVNNLIDTMVGKGWLGNKSSQGFYKLEKQNGKKEFWPLNLETMHHEPPVDVSFESLKKAKEQKNLGERLKIFLEADDRAGQLVRALTFQSLAYASEKIPEIADTPLPIDNAVRWGFGYEAGPFETWDMLGVAETAAAMTDAGFPPPDWVKEMLAGGFATFYQQQGERKAGVYNPALRAYEPIPRPSSMLILKELKEEGSVIAENPSASLIDLGDGVACVEFHTKANALDEDIYKMIGKGLDLAEADFEGLVIGNQGEFFCAGANLFMVVVGAQNQLWDQINKLGKEMQNLHMRMRYSPTPVVIAPAGLALGGGIEVMMHGSRVVAASELYAGAVEIGVGVIPAAGGTKEMLRRRLNPAMQVENADPLPFLQKIFEIIGLAKVSTSAEEARKMGVLAACDRVVMNRDLVLAEAKHEVLNMAAAGYRPPLPEKIYAAGRDALAAMRVGAYMMREGGYITEYEEHIAGKLAYVMCGGDLSRPTWVDEQYILDLEMEAFLSLCGEEKTQQRMWHMLQTGKALRN